MPTFPAIVLNRRPFNWKAAAPAGPPGNITFSSYLPRLPVPDFEQTLAGLKKSLAPIAWSESEYNSVLGKIDDFAEGQGPVLHERLLKHAEEQPHWLEKWWDDMAYLGYRESVVINVSYFYGFDSHPRHLKQNPAARAGGLARAVLIFRRNLKQGLLVPDATKDGPICMDTYRWMFDCCRIPGPRGLDWSLSYAREGDDGNMGHIIVFRNGRIWKLDVAPHGQLLSTEEFERQFQFIYNNTSHEYPGVGVLTASNRDVWAKDYAHLSSSAHNASILQMIQSAAFVVNLDSSNPDNPVHFSRALWHGDVIKGRPVGLRNRWVDKPVQFIIFDNGAAGLMGEHSVMDGTPTVRLCDEVLDMLHDHRFDHGALSAPCIPSPEPLDFEVPSITLKAIHEAEKAAIELIESQELGYLLVPYGKAAIKNFGFSPDSWAQMIIQLAYQRLMGDTKRTGGTYEAATTRKFYKGRTEVIRVVTDESDAWVRSMDNKNIDGNERRRLFAAAAKMHISLAQKAGVGQGIDRHLLGLKKLLQEGEPIPPLFEDPVFKRSGYWVLSTSAVFSKYFPAYGWGEVVPDGFGVAYMTGYDDRLQYTITSKKNMPNARFCQEISRAAIELYELCAGSNKPRL